MHGASNGLYGTTHGADYPECTDVVDRGGLAGDLELAYWADHRCETNGVAADVWHTSFRAGSSEPVQLKTIHLGMPPKPKSKPPTLNVTPDDGSYSNYDGYDGGSDTDNGNDTCNG